MKKIQKVLAIHRSRNLPRPLQFLQLFQLKTFVLPLLHPNETNSSTLPGNATARTSRGEETRDRRIQVGAKMERTRQRDRRMKRSEVACFDYQARSSRKQTHQSFHKIRIRSPENFTFPPPPTKLSPSSEKPKKGPTWVVASPFFSVFPFRPFKHFIAENRGCGASAKRARLPSAGRASRDWHAALPTLCTRAPRTPPRISLRGVALVDALSGRGREKKKRGA